MKFAELVPYRADTLLKSVTSFRKVQIIILNIVVVKSPHSNSQQFYSLTCRLLKKEQLRFQQSDGLFGFHCAFLEPFNISTCNHNYSCLKNWSQNVNFPEKVPISSPRRKSSQHQLLFQEKGKKGLS